MKFGLYLKAAANPRWLHYYLPFERLKTRIAEISAQLDASDSSSLLASGLDVPPPSSSSSSSSSSSRGISAAGMPPAAVPPGKTKSDSSDSDLRDFSSRTGEDDDEQHAQHEQDEDGLSRPLLELSPSRRAQKRDAGDMTPLDLNEGAEVTVEGAAAWFMREMTTSLDLAEAFYVENVRLAEDNLAALEDMDLHVADIHSRVDREAHTPVKKPKKKGKKRRTASSRATSDYHKMADAPRTPTRSASPSIRPARRRSSTNLGSKPELSRSLSDYTITSPRIDPRTELVGSPFVLGARGDSPPGIHPADSEWRLQSPPSSSGDHELEAHPPQELRQRGAHAKLKPKRSAYVDLTSSTRRLRKMFSKCYQHLVEVRNFAVLNEMAMRKISKRFDKHIPDADPSVTERCNQLRSSYTLLSEDLVASELAPLQEAVERLYADHFTGGNVKRAVAELEHSVTPRDKLKDSGVLGFFVGVLVALLFAGGVLHVVANRQHEEAVLPMMPVIRAAVCVMLFGWLWGILVTTWRRFHINYVYIFDFAPQQTLQPHQIFAMAAFLTATLALGVFCWFAALHTDDGNLFGMNGRLYVLIAILVFILFLAAPVRALHPESRRALAYTVLQVITSPFSRVRFVQVYVGDVITSLVHPLADMEYTVCFYASGDFNRDDPEDIECTNIKKLVLPFICSLPYIWRGMQCLRRYYETGDKHPNLTNAGKYLSGVLVTVMGYLYGDFSSGKEWNAGRIIWLMLFFIEALYMYTWDLLEDWGLRPWNTRNFMLRDQLLYPSKAPYYFAIVSNFFARFIWALTITPVPFIQNKAKAQWFNLGLSVCEIFRRFQWSFFRVENEYLNNQGKLRTFDGVPPWTGFVGQKLQRTRSAKSERLLNSL